MAVKSLIKRNYDKQPQLNYPDYKSSILRAPKKDKVFFPPSLSEVSGPIFNKNIIGKLDNDLTLNFSQNNASPIGHKIIVHGTIRDQYLKPIEGALIEIWQANAGGKYFHNKDQNIAAIDPNFAGCGRFITENNGNYEFITIQPGPYPYPNRGVEWRPMHIHFSIFGQAFAQRLITQMYFEGDPHVGICPIVQSIGDGRAIEQLVARLDMAHSVPMDLRAYRFDIVLRGPDATMFEKN